MAPEFFSAPPDFFSKRGNVVTQGDSRILEVAVGARGDPWGPVETRGGPRPTVRSVLARPSYLVGVFDGLNNMTLINGTQLDSDQILFPEFFLRVSGPLFGEENVVT